MALWLERLGANVFGLSLPPEAEPNLYTLLEPYSRHVSYLGDIRNRAKIGEVINRSDFTIAIHMAAQALVRRSYHDPLSTFTTNVMGTANVLDALRGAPSLKAILVVTTDKVYRNDEHQRPFVEDDRLGGHDPYSSSKAGAELVAHCWSESFFRDQGVSLATARAGNVIGGGDWSEDRLIPDIWRATLSNKPVELRYPYATRPWQHVLDPLSGYLLYMEDLVRNLPDLPKALNFGPNSGEVVTVGEVATVVSTAMNAPFAWNHRCEPQVKEAKYLSLDASLAGRSLNWKPGLRPQEALAWTAEWYKAFNNGANVRTLTTIQLDRYEALN